MDYRLLGFFSGFPSHHFPGNVADRLREELTQRDSLVFVCTDPAGHAKTDYYAGIMHGCFEEIGLAFAQVHLIDNRIEPSRAAQWIADASCVHLMGGHTGKQLQYLRETGLDTAIWNTQAAILGVSAGAINMAALGLGLANITVYPHYDPENQEELAVLLQLSETLPICAMEDDSAIFISGDRVSSMGGIHLIDKGKIYPDWEGGLLLYL